MRNVAAVSLLAAALLLVPASPTYAQGGGHGFQGDAVSHGGGFHGRFHGHPSAFSGSSRLFFDEGPWGGGMEPDEVVMVPQFVAQFVDSAPSEAPVPDPKFVFPPTPSASNPAGSHTVIVQRGSQIEVQSFPTAR